MGASRHQHHRPMRPRKRRQCATSILSDVEVQRRTQQRVAVAADLHRCALCHAACIPDAHPVREWAPDHVPRSLQATCGTNLCEDCLPYHLLRASTPRAAVPRPLLPCVMLGRSGHEDCCLEEAQQRNQLQGGAPRQRPVLQQAALTLATEGRQEGGESEAAARALAALHRHDVHIQSNGGASGAPRLVVPPLARATAPCPTCGARLAATHTDIACGHAVSCDRCSMHFCASCWWPLRAKSATPCRMCLGDARGWSRQRRTRDGALVAVHTLHAAQAEAEAAAVAEVAPGADADAGAVADADAHVDHAPDAGHGLQELFTFACVQCRTPCDREEGCFTVEHCGLRMCTWCGASAFPWEATALPLEHWDAHGWMGCPHYPTDPAAAAILASENVDAAVAAARRKRHAARHQEERRWGRAVLTAAAGVTARDPPPPKPP